MAAMVGPHALVSFQALCNICAPGQSFRNTHLDERWGGKTGMDTVEVYVQNFVLIVVCIFLLWMGEFSPSKVII